MALFVLLPSAHIGIVSFLAVYSIALLLGVIGHTPGGLGVFEAVIIFALGGAAPPSAVVAALLAYRAIYFLLPLLLSGALLAAFEVGSIAARHAPPGPAAASPNVASLVPMFLGVITFVIGVMLLVSGATPAFGKRLALLQMALPLWVVEGSQLVGSVTGRDAAVRRARPVTPSGRRMVAGRGHRRRQSGAVAGEGSGVHRSRRARPS